MSDLISREQALKAINRLCENNPKLIDTWLVNSLEDIIEELPSAEKTGKWKPFDLTYGRNIYFCTACNNASEVPTSMGEPVYKFCPWCGARMVE